jgi:hypothetical protein
MGQRRVGCCLSRADRLGVCDMYRDAGKSMVNYQGIAWSRIMRHVWKRGAPSRSIHDLNLAAGMRY